MKARTLLLILALFFPLTSLASFNWNWDLNPYVGIDGSARHLEWAKSFGEGHFDKDYQNGSAYIGLQLNKYLAVEGGYQRTNRVQKQQFYLGDLGADTIDPILGFVPAPGERGSRLHISEAEMKGVHFNLLGLWPVSDQTTLFVLAGAAWNKFSVSTVPVENVDPALAPLTKAGQQVIRWSSDRQAVLRVGGGLKQKLTSNLAGRIFVIWEDTARLSGSASGNGPDLVQLLNPVAHTDSYTAKSKHSILTGIGVSYYFNPIVD
jgi:opacity protein-like surface antigen